MVDIREKEKIKLHRYAKVTVGLALGFVAFVVAVVTYFFSQGNFWIPGLLLGSLTWFYWLLFMNRQCEKQEEKVNA